MTRRRIPPGDIRRAQAWEQDTYMRRAERTPPEQLTRQQREMLADWRLETVDNDQGDPPCDD